jgi:hypothetical protein
MMVLVALGVVGTVAFIRARRGDRCTDRRIGLLGAPVIPTSAAEAARMSRLLQLGEAGTYRVYNCGKIWRVDHERRELIVLRRPARFGEPGEADVYRVHNCGRILHVLDYERGDLIVEREPVEQTQWTTSRNARGELVFEKEPS